MRVKVRESMRSSRGSLARLVIIAATISCYCLCGAGAQVISQSDNVTICEGEGTVLTCVLNSNISSDDVQWYRFIKDTNTTVMVDPNGGNFDIMNHTNGSSSLTITNATKSYTGYFWVGMPSLNVCNESLIVTTSPSALTVNITKNFKNSSIVVQWDEVDDVLPTNYTVTWTNDRDPFEVATVEEQTSYTITGLTLDTVYTITVSAANRCGQGPVYSINTTIDTTTITTTTATAAAAAATTATATTSDVTATTVITTTTSNIVTTPSSSITVTLLTTTGDSGGSSGGAIAGGVIGAILAIVIIVLIVFIGIYWFFIYRKKKEEADTEGGGDNIDNNNDGDGDGDNDTKMCFHNPFSRLELTNMFIRVYTYLNCNDDSTVVLAVTNTSPDDLVTSDGSKIDSQQHSNPYSVSDVVDSKDSSKVETSSDVVDAKDFVTQPYPKVSILQRSASTKPPDMPPPAPQTFPRGLNNDLVSCPFGVNPYAIVDLEKIIGKATCKADTKTFMGDLPPKAIRQTSLPSRTTTADSVHHDASNKLKPLKSAPHKNTTDSSTHIASAETGADANIGNDKNTNANTSKKQQFTYAVLQQLPPSDKFIVTDDACVNYAQISNK